jgi:S-adenosylmethionine synthetase
LPSGLAEKIERIITLRKETVYIEVLMAMAERRLSHYIENRQKYPSMKNNFDEKIEEVRKYIEDLKKLKKNFFSPE